MGSRPKSDLIPAEAQLWTAAVIWGFAFVAQRAGMAHIGPLTYNGIRFLIGATALLPLALSGPHRKDLAGQEGRRTFILGGLAAGSVLFVAAALQQAGLVYTTAGKAGFVTGLYLVLVPFFGLFLRHRISANHWAGAAVALAGLYLLSVTGGFRMGRGDLLVFAGAVFWAAHILVIGWMAPRVPTLPLACFQFYVCGAASLALGLATEPVSWARLLAAAVPILYGGFLSIGIAYTLQVVAQKRVAPARASLVLSMESLFAALGGWIVLGESLSLRGLVGCALMLAGIVLSQLPSNGFSLVRKGK